MPALARGPWPAEVESAGRRREVGGSRFASGTLLASRYRIVTALGHGGMGEVYRADDLKLNQAVALKFLPSARATDAAELARLRGEVRLARQISHPNVCRVFDVVEIDGQSFLCMEYIDGEDLGRLLRRIGRLPVDKAIEIARELAAGLAVIHDGGLLHRDLKPANVMIDGRGRARIADFGIAVLAGGPRGGAGTPVYMAPEQRARGEVSIQSDLYSLGLVLHEMLTGRPPAADRPALPASVAEAIDPRIEAALLRCLDPDPARRPPSALLLSAALTGQDPLTLAAAAGIALSPEEVAAAPRVGSLRPAVASALLLAAFVCLAAVVALSGRVQTFRQIPSEHPEVLTARARNLLREFGYTGPRRDWGSGLYFDPAYHRYRASGTSGAELPRLVAAGRPPLYVFWYRESPNLLLPGDSGIAPENPPRNTPGEAYLELDLEGRLHHLEVIPGRALPGRDERTSPPVSWPLLLAAAGFDPSRLRAVPPQQVPPVYADSRAAWEGAYPAGAPTVHIETASFGSVPVWFDITGPWSRYRDPKPGQRVTHTGMAQVSDLAFHLAAFLTGFFLARHSVRSGRGDRRGAFRLAVFMFSLNIIGWLIEGKHILFRASYGPALTDAITNSCFAWMFYLGFEPYVRRLWPERIIAWNRLLAGRMSDPLVGRDVLTGCLFGIGTALITSIGNLGNYLSEVPRHETLSGDLEGPAQHLIDVLLSGLWTSLVVMILFLLLRIVLRRSWPAGAILWILLTLWAFMGGPPTGLRLACVGLEALLLLVAWIRFGPLVGAISWVTGLLCLHYPLTLDPAAWYSASGLFALLVLGALALYGFATTVAGQRWFARSAVLDD